MSIRIGNHVIMLRLEQSKEIIELSEKWVRESPETRSLESRPGHVTIVFAGKNMTVEQGDALVAITRRHIETVPSFVSTQSHLKMFGSKRDCFVVLMKNSFQLLDLREKILKDMKDAGIELRDGWGFNPHMTLAKGAPDDTPPMTRLREYSLAVKSIEVKLGDAERITIHEYA